MKNLKKYRELFILLKKSKPNVQKAILQKADNNFVNALNEISLNILKGNLKLSQKQVRGLKKHKELLRLLANRSVSFKKKKKTLVQSGSGFITGLIAPVLTLLSGAIAKHL